MLIDSGRTPSRSSLATVPLAANRHSYFFRRTRNLEQWSVCSSALLTTGPWDYEAMKGALRWLLTHHDGLRLRLECCAGEWAQWIAELDETSPLVVRRSNLAPDSPAFQGELGAHVQALRDGFCFPGDLFRVLAVELADGRAALVLVAHHVVVDAHAFAVAQEDLFAAYHYLATGKGSWPNTPEVSYSAFAPASIRHWLERRERVLPHWRNLRWDLVQQLPERAVLDRDAAKEERHSEEIRVALEPWAAAGASNARQHTITRALVAITRAYHCWTGQRALHLEKVFYGREPFGGYDLTRTVGWLSGTVPIILDSAQPDANLWHEAGRQLRMGQAFGSSYGTLKYLADDEELRREFAAHPFPSVSLNVALPMPGPRSRDIVVGVLPGMKAGVATPADTLRVFPMSGGLVVRNDNLTLCWDFSSCLVDRNSAQRFANLCREAFDRLPSASVQVTPEDHAANPCEASNR